LICLSVWKLVTWFLFEGRRDFDRGDEGFEWWNGGGIVELSCV